MRCRSTGPRRMRRSVLGLVLLCLLAPSAWGYRPFVSTDAAVVERARMEIELGYFTLARTQGKNTFLTPQIVVNYGFAQNLELVGEAGVEKPPDAGPQLVDPALFLNDNNSTEFFEKLGDLLVPSYDDGGVVWRISLSTGARTTFTGPPDGPSPYMGVTTTVRGGKYSTTTTRVPTVIVSALSVA